MQILPPAGSGWSQTSTIEGTKTVDAWVTSNEPGYFVEFGVPTPHVFIGFVHPVTDTRPMSGRGSITGQIVNLHTDGPPFFQLHEGAPFAHTIPWVGLNDLAAGGGQSLYVRRANDDGSFSITGVPNGTYQLVIWDEYLDIIFAFQTVTITQASSVVALGTLPVFNWFSAAYGFVFEDTNENGFKDPGEAGIPEIAMNLRFRDGTIYQSYPTDLDGFVPFEQVFPFFSWLVAEVDFAKFKPTGVTVVVDAGGAVDANASWPNDVGIPADFAGFLVPQAQDNGELPYRTEVTPPQKPASILLEGFQGFAGQSNVFLWGKSGYGPGDVDNEPYCGEWHDDGTCADGGFPAGSRTRTPPPPERRTASSIRATAASAASFTTPRRARRTTRASALANPGSQGYPTSPSACGTATGPSCTRRSRPTAGMRTSPQTVPWRALCPPGNGHGLLRRHSQLEPDPTRRLRRWVRDRLPLAALSWCCGCGRSTRYPRGGIRCRGRRPPRLRARQGGGQERRLRERVRARCRGRTGPRGRVPFGRAAGHHADRHPRVRRRFARRSRPARSLPRRRRGHDHARGHRHRDPRAPAAPVRPQARRRARRPEPGGELLPVHESPRRRPHLRDDHRRHRQRGQRRVAGLRREVRAALPSRRDPGLERQRDQPRLLGRVRPLQRAGSLDLHRERPGSQRDVAQHAAGVPQPRHHAGPAGFVKRDPGAALQPQLRPGLPGVPVPARHHDLPGHARPARGRLRRTGPVPGGLREPEPHPGHLAGDGTEHPRRALHRARRLAPAHHRVARQRVRSQPPVRRARREPAQEHHAQLRVRRHPGTEPGHARRHRTPGECVHLLEQRHDRRQRARELRERAL